jgi:hypothetical protein
MVGYLGTDMLESLDQVLLSGFDLGCLAWVFIQMRTILQETNPHRLIWPPDKQNRTLFIDFESKPPLMDRGD